MSSKFTYARVREVILIPGLIGLMSLLVRGWVRRGEEEKELGSCD